MSVYLGTVLIDNNNISLVINNTTEIEDDLITREIRTYENQTLSYVGDRAFYYCSDLTFINLPQVTSIDEYAFYHCDNLHTVNLPQVSFISLYAFAYCSSLTLVNLYNLKSMEDYAFAYCYSLVSISLPKALIIGSTAFNSCHNLTSISLSKATIIGKYAFRNCYNLTTLNLRGIDAVPSLGISAFASTPIGGYSTSAGTYGSIYVPARLLNNFITATNWSSVSSRIFSI